MFYVACMHGVCVCVCVCVLAHREVQEQDRRREGLVEVVEADPSLYL